MTTWLSAAILCLAVCIMQWYHKQGWPMWQGMLNRSCAHLLVLFIGLKSETSMTVPWEVQKWKKKEKKRRRKSWTNMVVPWKAVEEEGKQQQQQNRKKGRKCFLLKYWQKNQILSPMIPWGIWSNESFTFHACSKLSHDLFLALSWLTKLQLDCA